jgi:hypothetical protein
MNALRWTIKRLALVTACIGLLALATAQPAAAGVIKGSDPSSNATNQVLACEAMGGEATVESFRNVADGLHTTIVTCSGGMGGGWTCTNFDDVTACGPTGAPLPTFGELDPSIGTGTELWEVVDDGAGTAPPALVADNATPPADSPRVTAPTADHDDQEQDKAKGKKSKKGKKGGKGRKK